MPICQIEICSGSFYHAGMCTSENQYINQVQPHFGFWGGKNWWSLFKFQAISQKVSSKESKQSFQYLCAVVWILSKWGGRWQDETSCTINVSSEFQNTKWLSHRELTLEHFQNWWLTKHRRRCAFASKQEKILWWSQHNISVSQQLMATHPTRNKETQSCQRHNRRRNWVNPNI